MVERCRGGSRTAPTGTQKKALRDFAGPQWAGLDSNQRRLTPTGLQPVPFSHSGTDPYIHLRIIIYDLCIVKNANEKNSNSANHCVGAVHKPPLLIFPRD
jgi:hypothetical protein